VKSILNQKMYNVSVKLRPSNKRQDQVDQGAYDGRYKVKIVPDKKKQAKKLWARIKNSHSSHVR
jgi:hypothetical protein